MRPKGLDVFIYLRKSRKDIEEEKKSGGDILKRHRVQLLELAKKEDHNVVDILEEIESGSSIFDRPKVQKLLQRVEENEVDGVLVMDTDRIGRTDMYESELIYRAFEYSKTFIITPSEVIDPQSEAAELIFGVKSLISRQELRDIIKRLRRGKISAVKEGKFMGKRPPIGYLKDENCKLYPDKERVWIVQYIFEAIANGKGQYVLAAELDDMGVKPVYSVRWAPSTINRIIKNETYKGHIVWGKKQYTKRKGKYTQSWHPPEDWIRCDNAHEPIVSEELWNKANEMLKKRYHPPTNPTKGLRNPLAGVVVCALCGKTFVNIVSGWAGRRDRLHCRTRECYKKQKGVILDLVETQILNGLREMVGDFNFEEQKQKNETKEQRLKALDEQIKRKRAHVASLLDQRSNLFDLLEQKVYDTDTFLERSNLLQERIKTAEENISTLELQIATIKTEMEKQDEFIPRVKNVISEYEATDDPNIKNKLLKSVIDRVTILRRPDWTRVDHFEVEIYPLI